MTRSVMRGVLGVVVGSRVARWVAALALALWARAKVVRLAAWLRETLRRRELLLRLPGPRSTRLNVLGTVTGMVPPHVPMCQESVNKWFVKQLGELVRSPALRDEGALCLWVLNEKLPLHCFGSVFVYDIELARQILATKNLDDWDKGYSYKVSRPLIGHGVLSTSGPEWAVQRALIDKGFKPEVLHNNLHAILKTAREHCDKMAGQCAARASLGEPHCVVVDVHEELLKVTLDVLGRVAFSYDIGSVTAPTTKDAPLYDAFANIITSIEDRIRNPLQQLTRKLPLQHHLAFEADMLKLNSVVDSIISQRVAGDPAAQAARLPDLLDVLLAGLTKEEAAALGRGAGADTMSRATMVDNIKTMLFAGHDTTAALSTWLLEIMATHPEAQERLLAEAVQYLGPDFGRADKAPTLEVLDVMPYLNQVILEALRLYPSAAFTRTAKRDIQLGKHLIPEGTEVLVFPYFIHRDPRNYAEPDAFRPERWAENKTGSEQLSLQAQLARETLSKPFLPFSLGKRNCAGRALALVEVRVLLLQILANFKIRKPTPAEVKQRFPAGCAEFQDWPAMSLTLNPKGHLQVYEPRVR